MSFFPNLFHMESSDLPASLDELPDAPSPAAAAANASKARRGDVDDDDIIAAALCGRFVLSAEEVSLFFFSFRDLDGSSNFKWLRSA